MGSGGGSFFTRRLSAKASSRAARAEALREGHNSCSSLSAGSAASCASTSDAHAQGSDSDQPQVAK